MNVRLADPRGYTDSEFHFSEQPQLSEELRMLREQVRRFVEKEVMPHGEQWERDGKIPREIYRRMGALGFLGMRHAAEYGGTEMGPLASMANGYRPPMRHRIRPFSISMAAAFVSARWPRIAT